MKNIKLIIIALVMVLNSNTFLAMDDNEYERISTHEELQQQVRQNNPNYLPQLFGRLRQAIRNNHLDNAYTIIHDELDNAVVPEAYIPDIDHLISLLPTPQSDQTNRQLHVLVKKLHQLKQPPQPKQTLAQNSISTTTITTSNITPSTQSISTTSPSSTMSMNSMQLKNNHLTDVIIYCDSDPCDIHNHTYEESKEMVPYFDKKDKLSLKDSCIRRLTKDINLVTGNTIDQIWSQYFAKQLPQDLIDKMTEPCGNSSCRNSRKLINLGVLSHPIKTDRNIYSQGIYALCVSRNGENLYSATQSNDYSREYYNYSIKAWDTTTGKCLYTIDDNSHSKGDVSLCLSPDGTRLYVAINNKITIWDAARKKCLKTLELTSDDNDRIISCIVISADGQKLYSLSNNCDSIYLTVWDTCTGKDKHLCTWDDDKSTCSLCLSPDGTKLYVRSSSQRISVLDPYAWTVRFLNCHCDIEAFCLSSDGSILCTGLKNNTIKAWDTQTGQCLYTFESDHEGTIASLYLSPDNALLYSADKDTNYVEDARHHIKIWDIQTGKCLYTSAEYDGDPIEFTALCPSSDGTRLYFGTNKHTIQVWSYCSPALRLCMKAFFNRRYWSRIEQLEALLASHTVQQLPDSEKIFLTEQIQKIKAFKHVDSCCWLTPCTIC